MEIRYTLSQGFGDSRVNRVWGTVGGLEEWLDEIEPVLRTLPHNVHFTPAVRNARTGHKKAVECVPALWTDIDNKSPEDIARILSGLDDLDISPNLSVSSGWGTYLFWLLEHPEKDIAAAEKMNRTLALLCEGDTGAVNAAHTLRLPGSFNCKTSVPREVAPYLHSEKKYDTKALLRTLEECESLFLEYTGSATGSSTPRVQRKDDGASAVRGDARKFSLLPSPGDEGWKMIGESGEARECPLMRSALLHPDTLSYPGWMSLAGALRLLCGAEAGGDAFYSLSRLSKVKFTPDGTKRTWGAVCDKELKPWSCEKTPEGLSCPNRSSCKGILSVLGKVVWRVSPR